MVILLSFNFRLRGRPNPVPLLIFVFLFAQCPGALAASPTSAQNNCTRWHSVCTVAVPGVMKAGTEF